MYSQNVPHLRNLFTITSVQGTIFGLAPVSSTVPTRDVRDQKNRILPEPNGKTLSKPFSAKYVINHTN
jgi:hypothetical protein